MLKLLLLAGIIAAGGVIGAAGVSRVNARRNALREIAQDMKTMQNLLTDQGMTLRDALCYTACGSGMGSVYKKFAEQLPKLAEDADFDAAQEELSRKELTAQDGSILREYIRKLAESISAQEIALATERFFAEIMRVIYAVEESELGRAKVMQKVWLLAGVGIAVILI